MYITKIQHKMQLVTCQPILVSSICWIGPNRNISSSVFILLDCLTISLVSSVSYICTVGTCISCSSNHLNTQGIYVYKTMCVPLYDETLSVDNLQKQLYFLTTVDTLYPSSSKTVMGIEEVVNWEVDVSVQSTGLNTSDVQILLSSPSVQYLSSKEASWSVLLIEKGLNLQLYKVVCNTFTPQIKGSSSGT